MKLTIIPVDKLIIKDGVPLFFNFNADANIHAIQWSGESGDIEYTDDSHETISDITAIQDYIDAYDAEAQRLYNLAHPVYTDAQQLQMSKDAKRAEIDTAFDAAALGGQCQVTTGGQTWPIDCRRGGNYNDLQNIQGLISILTDAGAADDYALPGAGPGMAGVKGADNGWHACTFGELKSAVLPAMLAYGQALYVKKWGLEAQIDAATTITDVEAIVWQ